MAETFIVRFSSHDADLRAMDAMARLGRVHSTENGDNFINRRQLEELQRLEIPYKLVGPAPQNQTVEAWQNVIDAAYRHANRGRIGEATDLLRKGARLYPEHEKDFTDVTALIVGNHLRSKRGPGH